MNRNLSIQAIADRSTTWDCLVIGGGATGLGTAVEAASRGLKTVLVEKTDFAKGTSSRATKLAHGGVRYLEQGNIPLVRHALHERGLMLQNAPHLVHPLKFIIPTYKSWDTWFFGIGLKIYDLLAGKLSLGHSKMLDHSTVVDYLATVETNHLKGGVLYFDGQFDDARLAVALAHTVFDLGGTIANYVEAVGLTKKGSRISGAILRDRETGQEYEVTAKVVINATGVFVDHIREFDDPTTKKLIAVSQGAHLVLPKEFLPGTAALMVPKTSDGRVLFGIPWHDRVIIGTTDHEVPKPVEEPLIENQDISFIMEEAARYLAKDPTESDVLSCYVGLRPLVKAAGAGSTAALSRDHTVLISPSGLVTITGGKWTTYRRMGQDCIDHALTVGSLSAGPSQTENLPLHGAWSDPSIFAPPQHLAVYGTDREKIEALSQGDSTESQRDSTESQRDSTESQRDGTEPIHPKLPYLKSEILWAIREEMARTVEDLLSRRTRSLLLDSRASVEAAPGVAEILKTELNRDDRWKQQQIEEFNQIARFYQLPGS
jgi:glycerol-3-phosphate dehydrogenase